MVKTSSGKVLAQNQAAKQFQGVDLKSEREDWFLQLITRIMKGITWVGYYMGAGILAFSSLFTNSLSSLSQLIQIIELCILMELFNFEFDPIIGKFLAELRNVTGSTIFKMPLNDKASGLHNSEAGIWKGKLSRVGFRPYLFQEIGYGGILMLVSIFD